MMNKMTKRIRTKTRDTKSNIDNKMFTCLTWDSGVALNAVEVAVVAESVENGDRKRETKKAAARAVDLEDGELNVQLDFCDE